MTKTEIIKRIINSIECMDKNSNNIEDINAYIIAKGIRLLNSLNYMEEIGLLSKHNHEVLTRLTGEKMESALAEVKENV